MAEIIKCKIKIIKVFYPKDIFSFKSGEWASISADVIEEIEGTPHLARNTLRLSGKAPSLLGDREYVVVAKYTPHKQYGHQYSIVCMNEVYNFDDKVSQRQFLEKILTDHQINALYEQLDNPFEVIKNEDVGLLCTVNGIGETTAKKIISNYNANVSNGRAYVELDVYGLSKNAIDRLVRHYGSADTLIAKIRENPYILINDVDGIGWKRADELALNAGFDPQSSKRIEAYINYFMEKEAGEGNTWVIANTLISSCSSELKLNDANALRQALYSLKEKGILTWDDNKTIFSLCRVKKLEHDIAKELYRLQSASGQFKINDIDVPIKKLEELTGIEYTEEQKAAIKLVCTNNVSILTGYGGTGKSTAVAGVLTLLKGKTFAQTALSGRAAARLSEITSEDGYTIHRLLGYSPSKKCFEFDSNNPLVYDIIILDEVSMVGAELFYSLISAIKTGSKLIMIGDDGQLESIGLCNILKDMLNSGVVPVARLTKIHRQAAKSAIITESIRVRTANQLTENGWVGSEIRGELQDLELDIYSDPILSQSRILEQYKKAYNKTRDAGSIQVVVPQRHRGEICTFNLNNIIQGMVNPPGKDEVSIPVGVNKNSGQHSYTLRVDDKVIVNKNNYDFKTVDGKICPVYNGNRGTIKSISSKKKLMVVDFDQWGEVVIPSSHWQTIELAYALTCHKLQGSEAPYVIIGMDFSARIMLTREWLYTAITRAKKYCVVCSETKALSYSIVNSNVPYKQTFLAEYLKKIFAQSEPQIT